MLLLVFNVRHAIAAAITTNSNAAAAISQRQLRAALGFSASGEAERDWTSSVAACSLGASRATRSFIAASRMTARTEPPSHILCLCAKRALGASRLAKDHFVAVD